MTEAYILGDIRLSPAEDPHTAFETADKRLRESGIEAKPLSHSIFRRAVDARHRSSVTLVYTVEMTFCAGEIAEGAAAAAGLRRLNTAEPEFTYGSEEQDGRPLVVGMGPAGLFAALILAENGYEPVIIDRGDSVTDRAAAKERFYRTRILDTESNVQFGAGGAGAFSDGKLVTRINDPLCSYILRRFVSFGAPEDILINARPHVGTDLLSGIVSAVLKRITECGGKVIYRCRLEGFGMRDGKAVSALTSCGEIKTSAVVLATGHSARDTYGMLMGAGFTVLAKPFSVGVRTEHLQSDIDGAMYGRFAGLPALGHAEYSLSHFVGKRGVYSFCMCPGGEVIAAASEQGGIVVNGMSFHSRSGKNANSAIAVSVFPEDYGATPEGAIDYQRRIERAAYAAGGGEYSAPACLLGDFMEGRSSAKPRRVLPTYMGGNVTMCDISGLFPGEISGALRKAFPAFGRIIRGFDAPDTLLTAPETRTSSPVRLLRNADMTAAGTRNLYPCGEGAGYAGGITSSAADGVRASAEIMKKYKRKGS